MGDLEKEDISTATQWDNLETKSWGGQEYPVWSMTDLSSSSIKGLSTSFWYVLLAVCKHGY